MTQMLGSALLIPVISTADLRLIDMETVSHEPMVCVPPNGEAGINHFAL